MQEGYHENTEYISNSLLGWLAYSPKMFKLKLDKLLTEKEETSSMALGTMVHLALLEPDKFLVSDLDVPSGNMLKYCEVLIQGGSEEEAYEASGYKISKQAVINSFEKNNCSEYVKEKIDFKDRIFLSRNDKFVIDQCSTSILKNNVAFSLLTSTNCENELELYWEKDGVKKRGKVDKLVLDKIDEGIVYNVDIKTTSKNVLLFPKKLEYNAEDFLKSYEIAKGSFLESYLTYGYHRQQAMYDEGIKAYIKEKYNKEVEVEHIIIAVETSKAFSSFVYTFKKDWINLGKKELDILIEKYLWHTEANYWDNPKGFTEGIINI